MVRRQRLPRLHLLRLAERPALARADLRRPAKGARQARRRLRRGAGLRPSGRQAEMRQLLDQHPARGRHPRQPHPPAFGHLRHHLCRDARGHLGAEAGRPSPADDDARPPAPEGRWRGIAALRLRDARGGRRAVVGKLAAPRSADEHVRGRADQRELQLQLGVGVGSFPGGFAQSKSARARPAPRRARHWRPHPGRPRPDLHPGQGEDDQTEVLLLFNGDRRIQFCPENLGNRQSFPCHPRRTPL